MTSSLWRMLATWWQVQVGPPFESKWYGMAPSLLLVALVVLALIAYGARWLLVGKYRDEEVEARGASRVVGVGSRNAFAMIMNPVVELLVRLRVPANAVTGMSLLLSIGSGVVLARGWFALGGWLYLLAGMCDFLDGRVARSTAQNSKAGAALDSVLTATAKRLC